MVILGLELLGLVAHVASAATISNIKTRLYIIWVFFLIVFLEVGGEFIQI